MRRTLFLSTLLFSLAAISNAQTVDEVAAAFNAGAQANNEGNYAVAIEKFEQVIELADAVGFDADEYLMQAETYLPRLYYNVGMDDLKSGDYEKAVKSLQKSAEVADLYGADELKEKSNTYLAKAYYAYAGELRKANDNTNAVFYYKKSLEVDPEYHKPYYYLGMIAKDQDNTEDMIANLSKLIEVGDSKDKMVNAAESVLLKYYFEEGQAAIKGQNYSRGIDFLQKATQYGGADNSNIYYFLAEGYINMQKYDEAIAAAQKCAELENTPDEKAKGFYQLGLAYMGKGDEANACSAFKQAAVGNFEASANYYIETKLKCQ